MNNDFDNFFSEILQKVLKNCQAKSVYDDFYKKFRDLDMEDDILDLLDNIEEKCNNLNLK